MQPLPPQHFVTIDQEWQGLWTAIVTMWVLALVVAMMMTDISFRRQGWRWPLRLCLRACAVIGVPCAVIFFYVPTPALLESWPAIARVINTPARQAVIVACLVAVTVGWCYLSFAMGRAIGRICRYIAAGPPWLPWDRELDRQIEEEFHGNKIC